MSEQEAQPEEFRFWETLAFGAYVIGLFAIGFYAYSEGSWRVFGVLWIVASGAWLAGTALGFLFGVPRVRSAEPVIVNSSDSETLIVPNTNLEQISDWLTKIIVGATLVQLGPLAAGIGDLSSFIGRSMDARAGAAASGGVLVFNFVAGFIWGYLWCSLRVFREMQSLVRRERRVRGSEGSPSARG